MTGYSLTISVLLSLCVAVLTSGQTLNRSDKLWLQFDGKNGAGKGKTVVLIAGDDEYRSEEALPMLAKILAKHHGFHCFVLFPINEDGLIQPDHQENIPGMHLLKKADVLIIGLRFRNLPDEDMQLFDEYLESGKPIIGLRTSTHAFRIPKERKYSRYSFNSKQDGWMGGFGQRVLGDTWINHHGQHGSESTRGIPNPDLASHPILTGVRDIWGPTDVYGIRNLPASAKVLVHGQVIDGMEPGDQPVSGKKNDPMMPLAWIKNYDSRSGKSSRIFCTTMGAATDFQSTGLRRLIVNAVYWCAGKENSIRPDLVTELADPYQPTDFGFGNYRKNLRPADYDWHSANKQ